jgi:uncharacterized protein YdaU (DUF1376 family)
MAKAPPAFQFYPNDFMTGTSRFTAAEVGAYILLLCEQWHTGSVPGDDDKALALILRCGRAPARAIWKNIRHKFQREESGAWLNARLEDERQRQEDYRKNQSVRGKKSAYKRTAKMADSGANGGSAVNQRCLPVATGAQPEGNSSSSSSVRTPSLPPSRGRRRRFHPTVQAEAEHIRKSQEVKRLVAEGLTFVDASRRVGFT